MIPFEDDWNDVVGKARFGLATAGDHPAALGLDPEKLAELRARPGVEAEPVVRPPFSRLSVGTGMISNCYLLGASGSPIGVIVDPGADAPAILAAMGRLGLEPAVILLTHGHADHVGALDAMRQTYPVPVIALAAERNQLGAHAAAATLVEPGHVVTAGPLHLQVRHVPGHTAGMALFHEPTAGVAFTGDALFARSLGRASAPGVPYHTQIAAVRREILSLPPATILCPGHGPLTTVADERRLNPFFPG